MTKRLLAQQNNGFNIGDVVMLDSDASISSRYSSVGPLISNLLKNSLTLAGIILLVLIIVGGLGMIAGAGSGDSKKAEQSKKTLTSAIIGFAIVICAYFIIQIIQVITGLDILNSKL